MSSNTTSASFQATGGIPNHDDKLPSIILLCAYIPLLPIIAWRVISPSSRTSILFRPAIFVVARMVTWGIRLYLATRTTAASTGVYTAEVVLISIGLVFLTEPFVALLGYLVGPYASPDDFLLTRGFTILKIAIMASIGLGVASSSMGNKPNSAGTIKTFRTISAVIACVVILICLIIMVKAKSLDVPSKPWVFCFPILVGMAIADIFKLIQSLDHDQSSFINKKGVFYILLTIPEWIVAAMYSIPNLVTLFEIESGNKFAAAEGRKKGRGRGGGLISMLTQNSSEEALQGAQQGQPSYQAAPSQYEGRRGRRGRGGLITGLIGQMQSPPQQPQYAQQAQYSPHPQYAQQPYYAQPEQPKYAQPPRD